PCGSRRRSLPSRRCADVCWWTACGERIRTGKYGDDLFVGEGVTGEEGEMAAALSAKIPAPFIRIDFLRSDNGLVFGEFTSKPGKDWKSTRLNSSHVATSY